VRLRSKDRKGEEEYAEGNRNSPPATRGADPSDNGISISEQSDIRIIADEVNNALVIMGTSREYEMVESAIKELDILPKQVLIEATIFEIGLTGDLNLGVEWFLKNGGLGEGKTGQGQLNLGSDGISAAAPGFSYSIIDGATDVRFVINALESETNVQVLSSPSIMVLDNKKATINVGDEIPVPTRQSNSNIDPAAPTVNEIQYRNTGILLEVSPRINAGGLVTLEVNQEVSDAVTTETSGIDAPTIQLRTIQSTVAIQSGQSVILGGLIRNQREDSVSGLPFFSRLPGIGRLFSQTANSDRRTELLVVLTPYVIANPSQALAITEEYRAKLSKPIDSVHN
jgi:general secretion pathway protein D